ncbi:MAG TPA: cyclic nucleotide-binding domain-containing protein [Candidatus Limnocylindrales bacterium]|nr:cyclic nucleotide-binding domain-containing protein [Candidatus Limnocylindrales bacterium]
MTLTDDRKADLLAGCRLFEGLAADQLAVVAEHAVEVEFPSERVIARQGEVGTGFFVVVSGTVRVVRDGEVLNRLGPDEFFGEMSVLDQMPRVAAVIADGPVTCLGIAAWDFERLLLEEPPLALAILRGVARRLRAVVEDHSH